MPGKYAFVTGTDHGVGLALAEELLKRGYFVVAARVNPAENAIDRLQVENAGRMAVVECNVGTDESVSAMASAVKKLVPQIDLLINNAGILGDMKKVLGEDLDFDEMLRVINVNSLGPLRVTNALYPLLLAGKEKTVINISSEAGSIADCERVGWFGYCMSKAANNMQSALVHNNLVKQGGRVIAMHPGHVATYMRGHLDTTAKLTPEEAAKGILSVVLDGELPITERPVYLDYSGKKLPW